MPASSPPAWQTKLWAWYLGVADGPGQALDHSCVDEWLRQEEDQADDQGFRHEAAAKLVVVGQDEVVVEVGGDAQHHHIGDAEPEETVQFGLLIHFEEAALKEQQGTRYSLNEQLRGNVEALPVLTTLL